MSASIAHAPWLQWPEVKTLVAVFAQAETELRFVGGCVRDSLLGHAVQDVDAATPSHPEAVMALLERVGIRAIPTGIDHGTVTALIGGMPVEITTLRRDMACDGRHADVEYTDNWQEDAARRDFTINAMSANADGTLFDYFGGMAHINPLRIIFIGDAEARIEEDALRMLRFFRFSAQLGVKEYDAAALEACAKKAALIERLSGERIAQEMLKLLGASALDAALFHHMQQVGIVQALHLPAPSPALLHSALDDDALARLACWLMNGDAKALAERWKLSGAQRNTLQALMRTATKLSAQPDEREWKRHLRAEGKEMFIRALHIALATQALEENAYQHALALAENWMIPAFPVTGQDLLERGYAEGKALGDALKTLEAAWEAEDYRPTRETLLKLLGEAR